MGCEKTLDFNLTVSGEYSMETAIYVSSIDKILGCSGAYIHKCNATTGARESSTKIASPVLGPSTLALHGNGLVYWAGWFDPSWVDLSADLASPRADFYPVTPSTMAVGAPIDIGSIFPDLQGFIRRGLNGPHAVLSSGSYLYFLYRFQAGGGQLFRINPDNTAQNNTNSAYGWDGWNAWQHGTDGSFIYWPDPLNQYVRRGGITFAALARCNLLNADETPVAVEHAGTNQYAVCGNGWLIKVTGYAASGPGSYTPFDLEPTQAGIKPFKIRYIGGLLYLPCQATNTVLIWNPATDTVVSLETGFDGPVDVVGTGSKVFAVQSGPTGLREIT